MREKLVIIGANDFQNQLILKAKEMGYETHVFAWKCGDVGETTADYFYPISIVEKEKILKWCKEINPVGIATIASDLANITVNYVAEKMGLCCNGIRATELSTDKFKMRERFEKCKIESPRYILVNSLEELNENEIPAFPVIVKPTDRSGSRGISKIERREELEKSVISAMEESFQKKVLVEEFVEGEEYSVEYISCDGKHYFLALTRKFTTGAPNFIEVGHIQPAMISRDLKDKIINLTENALNALEIKNGASHTEVKVDNKGNIKIIEIGSRMGGDCIGSDLVPLSTGYDFMKMVIDIACGSKVKLNTTRINKNYAIIRFIFSEKDIKCLDDLKENSIEKIYRISPIEEVGARKVKDSASRYGYYIVTTEDEDEAKVLLEKMNMVLKG